jgi:hypothetical protein
MEHHDAFALTGAEEPPGSETPARGGAYLAAVVLRVKLGNARSKRADPRIRAVFAAQKRSLDRMCAEVLD